MFRKIWNSEPVVFVAFLLVVVMLAQKLWLGEVITQDWVLWVLGLFGVATGATVLRNAVTPANKEHELEDHGND